MKLIFGFNRIIERKKHLRGPTPWPGGWGRGHPYWARPLSPGPRGGPPVSIFRYMKAFTLEKIMGKLTGRTPLPRGGPWRNQSRAPAEPFYRGHIPPGGGNHHHRHHQRPSHQERAISINIFTSTISSPNPSSSLVSNSCLQVRDWC